MYKIDKSSNSIQPLDEKSFSSLGIRERDHLQEWIAKQPDVLGEEFLIIQKEFSGFYGTNERPDLLALDKQGALVTIENKLDDSGKDVTWQALKYASYCSSLSKANITKIYQQYLDKNEPGTSAEERISDFMDAQDFEEIELNKGISQRIILIAAKFRKEVTSTVLWLMNFKVRLQCFRATPFAMGEELFLNVEQIIPTKDTEDYMVGMAEKAQDDIESQTKLKNIQGDTYLEFWTQLVNAMKETKSEKKYRPRASGWIGADAGCGVTGVRFKFAAGQRCGRVELYIDCGEKAKNESIFDHLHSQKKEIETAFGDPLVWERMDGNRVCKVGTKEIICNVFERDQWQTMIGFMTDAMCRLEKAIEAPLLEVGKQVKSGATTT